MINFSGDVKMYILVATLLFIIGGLFIKRVKSTYLFGGSVVVLLVLNVIQINTFLVSLSNESILTIFLLIFITTAVKTNFNLIYYIDLLFKNVKSPRLFIAGMTTSVALLSSVVNNTPIVALLIPYIQKWSKDKGFASSKFLIPLAYSATLGGMITVIGTSTNLVLNGLITANGMEGFYFLDFFYLGLIVTALGVVYFTTIGYNLLPKRLDALDEMRQNPRNYILETKFSSKSSVIGKTVLEAGLRNLSGVYLTEVVRDSELISPIPPDFVLKRNDLLYFAGDTENVLEIMQNPKLGLELHKANKYQLGENIDVVEALIPTTSNLAGKKVRDSNFREKYDAAIVAIHRNGHKIGGKIGDVVLQFGDLLLISTGKKFKRTVRLDKNLYVLSTVSKLNVEKKIEKSVFLAVMLISILGIFMSFWSLFVGLLLMLSSLFVLKLFSFEDLKRQLNLELLIILVSAITLGTALINTGTVDWINHHIFFVLEGKSTFMIITSIFLITVFLTSFVTNVAAVSIMFPLAASLIETMGLPAKPVFLAIAFAASAAFLTPVSYQTNLMVLGPGGYNNRDFLKSGLLLTVLYCFICIAFLYQKLA